MWEFYQATLMAARFLENMILMPSCCDLWNVLLTPELIIVVIFFYWFLILLNDINKFILIIALKLKTIIPWG